MQAELKTRPWAARAGLILGPIAWAANQQFTSTYIYAKCGSTSLTLVLSSGIVCACLAVVGLLLSWRAKGSAPNSSTTSFTATLGTLSGAIALLVIIAGTIAGFLLPACYQ
jgi:hypothetical protein